MTGISAPLLSVENLCVGFRLPGGRVDALKGVSFELRPGEILGIVGESGSGKSVTCRAVLGLLPSTAEISGRAVLEGQDLLRAGAAELHAVRGRKISMIFQNPSSHLDPLMTIGGHIAEPLRFHLGRSRQEAHEEAVALLRSVRIADPEIRVRSYPHQLSGGMKQRAMIASAIACRPRVLLADEPTTALDVTVQARILDLLRELNRESGLAVVLISHDLGVIAEICSRVVVMKDGRVVESGPTRDVIDAPRQAYTRLLIQSQPEERASRSAAVPKQASGPLPRSGDRTPILEIQDLSVRFPLPRGPAALLNRSTGPSEIRAVDGVSFEIAAGETLGIVGESGSGKSTVARAIARLIAPSSGMIRFRGGDIGALTRDQLTRFRRSVQMVFQSPSDSLNPRLTARETVVEPLLRHRLCPRGQAAKRARELMELVELPPTLLDRRPDQLSGGQCQRVGIARALAMKPEVLIADEITSALDVTTQAQILALLDKLRARSGLTILYISHDLSVVRSFCQRVAVFRHGRIVEMGGVNHVLSAPREDYTRDLIASIPRLRGRATSVPAGLPAE